MQDVRFEFGTDGPKVSWNPFARQASLEDEASAIRKELDLRSEAAKLAELGLPDPYDTTPSFLEQLIRSRHASWLASRRRRAERRRSEVSAELKAIAIAVTEGDLDSIETQVSFDLAQTRSQLDGRLSAEIEAKVDAESALASFNRANDSAHQPTGRSILAFAGAATGNAFAEALFNGSMFQDKMGLAPAVGFVLGLSGAFALFGSVIGIGWQQMKRKALGNKLGGGFLLIAGILLAATLMFLLAHFRAALGVVGGEGAAAAARVSIDAAPLAPFKDASTFTYLAINVGCVWIVAAKAGAVLGWLDLRQRRATLQAATSRVDRLVGWARGRVDDAAATGAATVKAMLESADENANRSKALVAEDTAVRREHNASAVQISRFAAACEQEYRETIRAVHKARSHQPRFADPPPGITEAPLEEDPEIATLSVAVEARLVGLRRAAPDLLGRIRDAATAMQEEIGRMVLAAENEVRLGRGRPDATLRAVA